ncbi:hypothetical protein [Actinosynnema sp. ALI-1.44]|uniref:hypothetical protein n=1 Tax=Actinosynnema sp. ALI-1.44 TaxID=1933779 RepID=UPI001178CA1E|nr:hypothetical protein [Actinosynnema sp. ALI-1.44]
MEDPSTPTLNVTEFYTSLFWSAGNVVSTGDSSQFIRAMAAGIEAEFGSCPGESPDTGDSPGPGPLWVRRPRRPGAG